jgi:AbrB family looped-hinge helix DNA binding protein
MAKVTSKLQVTVPKAIADLYRIRRGDEIEWIAAGDGVRVIPARGRRGELDLETRLRLFDEATARQVERNAAWKGGVGGATGRGWTRDELYVRGGAG